MQSGKRISIGLVEESDHPDVIETFGRLPKIHNIHRILANSPTLFARFTGFAHALRFDTKIDPADRELAILCVLDLHGGEYEAAYHRVYSQTFGLSEEQVMNVTRSEEVTCYDGRQRAVLRFAERFAAAPAERDRLPDSGIEQYYDDRERLELALTLTLYLGLAHFTGVIEVPAD